MRSAQSVLDRARRARQAVLWLIAIAVTSGLIAACGAKQGKVPPGTNQPDKFLFEKGTDFLEKRKWLTAREYFQTLVETYPQSPYRADAKLGVGDCYLGEGSAASQVQAIQEFREFLSYFPTHPRADYAQYKLAMAHYYQMAKPERDQSETKHAIEEFDTFFSRYPNSKLIGEAKQHAREAHDRLSESEYRVGYFYFRMKWYPGSIDRFQSILKSDPEYTHRDAVYFYLAQSQVKVNRPAEALPVLQKLIDEFVQSEYLAEAQKLMADLKAKGPFDTPTPTDAAKTDPNKPPQAKDAAEPKKSPAPNRKPPTPQQ
jgi:outer membrane protein assembly factor BamD